MEYKTGDKVKLVSKEKLRMRIKGNGLDPNDFDEIVMPELTNMLGHTVEICSFDEGDSAPFELWTIALDNTWWFTDMAIETSCIQT